MLISAQLEQLQHSLSAILPAALIAALVFTFAPTACLFAQRRFAAGLRCAGCMLLGHIACAGLIFAPLGLALFYEAYSTAWPAVRTL